MISKTTRWLGMCLALVFASLSSANAQVFLSEGFDASTTIPTGWTSSGYSGTSLQSCSGNSFRDNIYSGSTTGSLETPDLTGSNGTDVTVSYDYKVVDWSAATVPTTGDWGTILLEYSTDGGATYTTINTVNPNSHTPAASCATITEVIPGASVPSTIQVRITGNFGSAGDFYIYLDNVLVSQAGGCNPPSSLSATPASGTEIEVSFVDNASAQNFNVEVVAAGAAQGTGTSAAFASSPAVIAGLQSGVAYEFYVQADCGSSQSSWSGPVSGLIPPPNDVCSGAVDYASAFGAVSVNGSCPGAEVSLDIGPFSDSGDDPTCDFGSDATAWYTWTATAASVEFTSGLNAPGLEILSGSCGSFTSLGCLNNTSGTIGGLTIGASYYLIIWDDGDSDVIIDWCLQEGPACGDPTSLTTTNITETSADVTFNALAAGGHTVEYGATGFTLGTGTTVAVPSGGAASLTGLTQLTGYDVYVTADCGSAQVGPANFTTLGPPPANDDCAGAIAATVNADLSCTSTSSGTIAFATASSEDPSVCGGTENDDVWFSFVATATSHNISLLNITGGTTDLYHSLWEGTCGALTSTGLCSDPNTSTATGLTIGSTYYLRVYSWTSAAGQTSSFDVCIGTFPPPPVNDACAGAISILDGQTLSGSNVSATDVEGLAPCNGGTVGMSCVSGVNDGIVDWSAGVWYVYTSTSLEDITINVDGFDTELQVFTGACGALTCVAGDDDSSSGGCCGSQVCFPSTATASRGGAAPPEDYYIYVDGHGGATGTFTLTLTTSGAPLPVELASFNAYAAPKGNVVEWTAATEVDFFMYTVERAIDPASFSSLAEVAPKGTEFSEAVYTSQDLNPSAVTYYRLRMEDLDGTVEYSDVVAVRRDDISGGIKMFPNPAKEHVTFEVLAGDTDNGTVSVVLTDLNGRSVREWNLATGQRTSVSLSGIPSGVYMVSSVSAAGTASQRLVID